MPSIPVKENAKADDNRSEREQSRQ